MRLSPALWTCWVAAVALAAGCSTWKVAPGARQVLPVKAPHSEQTADTGRTDASARLHGSQARVPPLRDTGAQSVAGLRVAHSPTDAALEIEREMARAQAAWEARRHDMTAVRTAPADPPEAELTEIASTSRDCPVTARMLAVERVYAPRFLNCRIRVRTLETRLAEASGAAKDSLRKRLDQARQELAALDDSYAKDIEIARLDNSPVIVKDEEAFSSRRNIKTDNCPDGKAGGGAD